MSSLGESNEVAQSSLSEGRRNPFFNDTGDSENVAVQVIYYSHDSELPYLNTLQKKSSCEVCVCTSFDELLNHLETNSVEWILFDNSINKQEQQYLTHWARIFKPELKHTNMSESIE